MWIETDRLILRKFQQLDFKELAPILADAKVMKFATTGVHSIEQVQQKIANFIACYEHLPAFGSIPIPVCQLKSQKNR